MTSREGNAPIGELQEFYGMEAGRTEADNPVPRIPGRTCCGSPIHRPDRRMAIPPASFLSRPPLSADTRRHPFCARVAQRLDTQVDHLYILQ